MAPKKAILHLTWIDQLQDESCFIKTGAGLASSLALADAVL
jgi:hypothetical protein